MKLGVVLASTKTRRAKLSAAQLQVLAALGLEWAEQALSVRSRSGSTHRRTSAGPVTGRRLAAQR
ncbi:hypothetical protein ACF1GT_36045 [Streptomyces sp. NPDC014636]|uniref:hypothetical protein n=1 Tax=Streptomyces sp. NPDC014636 TaxID=3364876 RepID=UPI0037008739